MRFGLAPLSLAVAVAATRLTGTDLIADLLGCLYLTVVTITVMRDADLKALQRA
jgi:hypothetical protein